MALALTGGFTVQDHAGSINPTTEILRIAPGTKLPAPLRTPSEGVYSALNPYFGASAELMAPAFEWFPGRPRLFANAEILPSFTSSGSAALENAATGFLFPEKIADQPTLFPQEAIAGVGSRLTAKTMTTVLAAGIGAAFPFEVRGRLLRVKPSVGWIRYGVVIDGVLLAAFKNESVPLTQPVVYGRDLRLVTLSDQGDAYFNAVGPGIEIEMELAKWGGFRPSLYLEGHGYRTVGNQTIEIEDRVSFDDVIGANVYTTTWRLRVADWMYRAGLGFRLRWVGGN